jgi:peptidoglycan/LPS O-acetylase OafA/YrhL
LSGPQPAQAKTPSLSGGLGFLGRWSLTFYMLHQPILLGALELFLMFRRSL